MLHADLIAAALAGAAVSSPVHRLVRKNQPREQALTRQALALEETRAARAKAEALLNEERAPHERREAALGKDFERSIACLRRWTGRAWVSGHRYPIRSSIMDPSLKHISHHLSALLRHRAGEVGLRMDAAGWVDLDELVAHLGVPRHLVEEVVQHNNKARFEIRGGRIRASQGHSLAGMPVTQEALEASWAVFPGESPLWHGTRTEAVERIAQQGILRGERSHVHLAASRESQVGKRANVGVLLEIAPAKLRAAGQTVFQSPNGVILCRYVPPACIVDVHAMSRSARKNAPALRAAFGLPA